MRVTLADVFEHLIAEGLATRESAERARAGLQGAVDEGPPWFARVIAGFGAWIATGCLIGFLFVTKIVNDEWSSMIVGAVVAAAAVYLRRVAAPEADFKRQLALAASLTGQLLLILGVATATKSAVAAGLVALGLSLLVVPLVPDQAHRFMATLVGSIGATAAMADLRLHWAIGTVPPWGDLSVRGSDIAVLGVAAAAAYVWRVRLRERSMALSEMLEPVGYGTIAALFGVLLFSAVFALADDVVRGTRSTRVNAWQVGPLTTLGLAAGLVALELSIFAGQQPRPGRATRLLTVLATALLALLTLSTPGVIAAVTVLVLGFDRRNRILLGLAAVFLAKFLSAYYYSLQMTLLEKAVVLVASGLVMLAGWGYARPWSGSRAAEA